LQNSIKASPSAKAGVQKFLKRLDSRFRGNDKLGLFTIGSVSHPFGKGDDDNPGNERFIEKGGVA
jgi:hypothetical protein